MNVAVLGASHKPERYSNMAVRLLREKGHAVFPVNPALAEIEGIRVYPGLGEVSVPLDTVTVYLGAERSRPLAGAILAARPQRVIFNPGAENAELADKLRDAGIEVVHACTLVLLKTGGF